MVKRGKAPLLTCARRDLCRIARAGSRRICIHDYGQIILALTMSTRDGPGVSGPTRLPGTIWRSPWPHGAAARRGVELSAGLVRCGRPAGMVARHNVGSARHMRWRPPLRRPQGDVGGAHAAVVTLPFSRYGVATRNSRKRRLTVRCNHFRCAQSGHSETPPPL